VPEDHLVIDLAVNPSFDDALDVAEVAHHVPVVQRCGSDLNLSDCIVTVRVFADTVVVQQSVAVTEVEAFRDGIHWKIVSVRVREARW
jgi:hypothetical protein